MTGFVGKTALVTGARGIAEAIAKHLFALGINLIIISQSDSCEKLAGSLRSAAPAAAAGAAAKPNAVESTTQQIKDLLHIKSRTTSNYANRAVAIRADLSSVTAANEVTAKALEAAKTFEDADGKIDYLILCGGIMPMATLEKVDEKTWNQVFNVNVVGPALAPHLGNDGRIIFFSSSLTIASFLNAGYLTYVASKGAIEQTARALAKDEALTSRGISTTIISPGPTETELFTTGKSSDVMNTMKQANPYKKLGDPKDIALAVEGILVSGKWLNGSNIRANGGSAV
ncbi:SubName: Full=Related to 3-oxoacyl-[acyl-carrier-protein] reductase {ECO:0000313/EMBL:CCA71605.1} [Serendipita indica DSM 11827]|nr:SubName: Full=Related to 3-oxoacyl-[acyl-carrier-protein] reductase {ECO:0000313/EMBL:CCA71605.1} [Serendipita indica DSM 11827]